MRVTPNGVSLVGKELKIDPPFPSFLGLEKEKANARRLKDINDRRIRAELEAYVE